MYSSDRLPSIARCSSRSFSIAGAAAAAAVVIVVAVAVVVVPFAVVSIR